MKHRIAPRLVQNNITATVKRNLPWPGEIIARRGDRVTSNDVIGQVTIPAQFTVIDVAAELGLVDINLADALLKKENDSVETNEIIAQLNKKPALFKRSCKSPVSGKIRAIQGHRVLIETQTGVKKISALVSGTIASVEHPLSVTIEINGAYIEAACALGPDGCGLLAAHSDNPNADMTSDGFDLLNRQTVFIAGGTVNAETIRKAEEMDIAGIIVGSISPALLELNPPPKIPIIATEGFGKRPMAAKTYDILKTRLNAEVSIQTQATETGQYPLIIIPDSPMSPNKTARTESILPTGYAGRGSWVRNLRDPTGSEWGQITDIPPEARPTSEDISHIGAEVRFPNKTRFIPWQNMEHMG